MSDSSTRHQTELGESLESGDQAATADLLEEMVRTGELTENLAALSTNELGRLAIQLQDKEPAEFLEDLDPTDAAEILSSLTVDQAARVLETVDADNAVDIVSEIEPERAEMILVAMDAETAEELRELLVYPPDTAGGRMTPAFVSVDPSLRADQAVQALRQVAQEAETIYYVYVTDAEDHLHGVLSLRGLVLSPPSTPVRDLMVRDMISVLVTADQEDAARTLNEYDLLALPVVDEDNRLLGIITADDVADILEQEATEDIERLGGSEPLEEPYLGASPFLLWRKRIVWLLVLFLAAAYTTTVLQFFEEELETAVALAFFIPLLIGTGGNVGSQVVTTIVRAMAVENIRLGDIIRVVTKEARVGVMLGVVMSLVMFGRAVMLRTGFDIALIVASSVLIIVFWATIVGSILPLLLRKAGVDPAVVSAPLISTLVDGTGLLIYFMIARAVLS
jgi:magnesium transporter